MITAIGNPTCLYDLFYFQKSIIFEKYKVRGTLATKA